MLGSFFDVIEHESVDFSKGDVFEFAFVFELVEFLADVGGDGHDGVCAFSDHDVVFFLEEEGAVEVEAGDDLHEAFVLDVDAFFVFGQAVV